MVSPFHRQGVAPQTQEFVWNSCRFPALMKQVGFSPVAMGEARLRGFTFGAGSSKRAEREKDA